MVQTDAEKRAYQRGYFAGSRGRWSEHKPPLPPDDVARRIIEAARRLRDGCDGEIAKFDEDDPMALALAPLIDDLDDALTALSHWLKAS